jgi:hypothetical protein
MEAITEALHLLKRQAEIQNTLRHSNANRVLAERELYLIRQWLARHPAAVQTIGLAASELHQSIDALSVRDVEKQSAL